MTQIDKSKLKQAEDHREALHVNCDECFKDVPVSVESEDYVAYFCGLGCYNLWKKKHNDENLDDTKVYVYQDPELD